MKLSEVKAILPKLDTLYFQLPNGEFVPSHFHVTEVGEISKSFIDCGGKLRKEKVVNFQLWDANDYNHRLHPEKLLHIIELSEEKLGLEDLEIEVEYQGETIGKFGLEYSNENFKLTSKQTDCLAKDSCGVDSKKKKVALADIGQENSSCCAPDSNCC